MSNTPRVDEELQRLNDAIRAGEECDDVAEAYAWTFARQLERELAEANRKLAERINDDQRYLVAPLCNAEKALDDCQAELAEARAEVEHWKGECSGCSFAHNNPADGQMRWEAKL